MIIISSKMILVLRAVLSLLLFDFVTSEHPCAARQVSGESVVCVCNSTYCDDIVRDAPEAGSYVTYTSTKDGARFVKATGRLEKIKSNKCCSTTLVLDPVTRHQTIEGFGGAVTDAAGIHWKNLSNPLQDYLIRSYFADDGLQYNMLRVPIGGTDFSTHPYAYNELPQNDTALTNFTLSPEDYDYKLPMIKAIEEVSSAEIDIVATTWSPPVWMKTNHAFYGFSRLIEEYYQTYADYHLKFLEKYAHEGVRVWALTTTNEPVNGVIPLARFNSLGWNPGDLGKWIANNLGPTIRNSTAFKDVKILAIDDQRYSIPVFFNAIAKEHPEALNYIDGVAVHYYGDLFTPASILSDVPKKYPGKFVIATEACEGSFPWEFKKVVLGSWQRAVNYMKDILTDLNHDVVGWIDWNLCLDSEGGPNWAKNRVDAPIIVFPENDEFIKQPMFYAMGHFAKFVPRGSVRIKVKETKGLFESSIENVAFITPSDTIVAVLYNSGKARSIAVRLGEDQASIHLEKKSFTTVEISYQNPES